MKNITELFDEIYEPVKLIAILKGPVNAYCEAYDLDNIGLPINAHPLSVDELRSLNRILTYNGDTSNTYLKPNGLLPQNVIYINPDNDGFVIWYSAPQKKNFRFVESLGIPDGFAHVPALIWKADKDSLAVFAIITAERPSISTQLFNAPFFNIGKNGSVCMGNVKLKTEQASGLEDFISQWENNFFDSYFSHLIVKTSPIDGNIIQLWNELINSEKPFPVKVLKKTQLTIKSLFI